MAKAILYDASKCTGCRACQVACKSWNQRGITETHNEGTYENPLQLTSECWTRILFNEPEEAESTDDLWWHFTKVQCMQCTDATCVKVCPSGATKKYKVTDGDSEAWLVKTDSKKCIGCNYCVATCPFQACRYSASEKGIFRCVMCMDRIGNNPEAFVAERSPRQLSDFQTLLKEDEYKKYLRNKPACVSTCPSGALSFGEREEMAVRAKERVEFLKATRDKKNARVYGLDQLGGLHYIYVLEDAPVTYGLPANPSVPAAVAVWETVMKPGAPWGGLALVGLAAAAGVGYVVNKRNEGLERKAREGGD